MENKTLHMIGNAHLDPVWLWRWQEGFHEAKATFRSALDRIAEYDDFIFTSSSAAFFEWIEQNDAAMFAEIKQRVAEGRIKLVGGWWIEPDCNIPSGESYVRQGLYGQRYFQEKFGKTAKIGYNLDSFGHNGMLPQILKKSGLHSYVFMRPMPGEKALPARLFRWQSDDGSEVTAFRLMFEYLTWGDDVAVHVQRCAEEMGAELDEAMVFYGVGNHGGGPTIQNIESIHALQKAENGYKLLFSDPESYFETVDGKKDLLPVFHGDLQHHASGCYAAHSGMKRWNRETENLLLKTEKFSVAAETLAAQAYPDLSAAWKSLLFNQFHDTMAGTSLESCYEDARDQYGESRSVAARGMNYALQALSWNIGIEPEENMLPVVVFNPNSFSSSFLMEAEFTESAVKDALLLDPQGNAVPYQRIQPHASSNGRARICFTAPLPALGYRVFRLKAGAARGEGTAIALRENGCLSGGSYMENDQIRFSVNPQTGCIDSLYDKKTETEVFCGEAAVPAVMKDESDTWSHDVLSFREQIGVFVPTRVYRTEEGPVRTTIRVESAYGASRLLQDFTIYPGKNAVDVKVSVDWRECREALKLLFPVNVNFPEANYEIPYGVIGKEGNGHEQPMQNWADVSGLTPGRGNISGVAIVNDGKYSAHVYTKEIGLTVLRSPIFAHHNPYVPDDSQTYRYIDHGMQSFSYSIVPHQGTWEEAGVVQKGYELNQRPEVVIETTHAGKLPHEDSFLSVSCDNIVVSALKKAEDGNGYVLRAYECSKKPTDAIISLPLLNTEIKTRFGACEIKTFRITGGQAEEILMTELP